MLPNCLLVFAAIMWYKVYNCHPHPHYKNVTKPLVWQKNSDKVISVHVLLPFSFNTVSTQPCARLTCAQRVKQGVAYFFLFCKYYQNYRHDAIEWFVLCISKIKCIISIYKIINDNNLPFRLRVHNPHHDNFFAWSHASLYSATKRHSLVKESERRVAV